MKTGKKFKLGFLPTMLCVIAVLVAACGKTSSTISSNPTPAAKSQQVLKEGVAGGDIVTFDPAISSDAGSINAINMVFTGLVQQDDALNVKPQEAKSYTVSSDGLTYTFYLKSGLKFSDGNTLDAHDVAWSIDRALSPSVSNQSGVTATYLGLIKDSDKRIAGTLSTLIGDSIKVIDANTISLTISQKSGYFLESLTYPTAYTVEKSVIEKWGDKWTDHLADNGGQGGDGPFKVQNYDHNSGIIFVANSNYYGSQPVLQKVEFLFYKTSTPEFAAYKTGSLDVSGFPSASLAEAEKLTGQYHTYSSLWITYLSLNYLYKPFNNIKIRQAFELAINKDVLNTSIFLGSDIPTCHMVPKGMPGYDASLTCPQNATTKGDIAKAKALFAAGMKEEGYTAATFPSITFTYAANSPTNDKIVTSLEGMWQQNLGVTVTSKTEEYASFLADSAKTTCSQTDLSKCMNTGLQMWLAGWIADYPDPQDWTSLLYGKGQYYNNVNYGQNLSTSATSEQTIQALMDKADASTAANRMSLYYTIEQAMVNDVAAIPLYQVNSKYVSKTYVYGLDKHTSSLGETAPDDWADIYIAAH